MRRTTREDGQLAEPVLPVRAADAADPRPLVDARVTPVLSERPE